ncbi:MAG: hypothetical protein JEZ11_14820 [Desulfobacterales bacterium]|nr:hypothetical protein [Desulfobacterales bacterium]
MFIDSYHQGYAWSDGITDGIQKVLADTGAELKIFRMDTKRNGSDDFKKAAAEKAKAEIESFKPDVVIAADDNASKFLVAPFYKDAALPFVFCGVNWDATVYGFPCKNVTGMVEVTPIPQLIDQLKPYAKGTKIGFLAPDLLTAKKEAANYKTVFGLEVTAYYAKDFEDWKKGFTELQSKVDMLIIDSDGGLYADKAQEMVSFVEASTKIPTGAAYDFMASYALITYGKVASEQGAWAADAAVKILGGTSPASIEIAQNQMGQLIVNTRIAQALGVELPFELLSAAEKVIE